MHTHTVMVSSYWDKLKNIQLLRKEEQMDKFLRNLYEVRFMIRLYGSDSTELEPIVHVLQTASFVLI